MKKTFGLFVLAVIFILTLGFVSALWPPVPGDFIDWPDHDCNVASDCGTNTDCVQYMCVGFGSCIIATAPAGTIATGPNECKSYVCDANGGIIVSDKDNGLACGSAGSYCFLGNCLAPITSCDDGNICTQDLNTGINCMHIAITGCCTSNAQCASGSTCNLLNNQCQTPSNCNDGNACTTGDTSMPFVGCVGTPITCNDNNALTTDSCVPATGCVYTPIVIAPFCGDFICNNGETCSTCITDCGPCQPTSCDDENACTTNDIFVNDVCVGQALNCDDQNSDTMDSCDTSTGCVFTPIEEEPECTNESTVVGGTIYQETLSNGIEGAVVEVICHHGLADNIQYAFSGGNGQYSVAFPCNECDYDDEVTVNAQKDSLTGTEEGEVDMTYNMPCGVVLNVGIVNVPLVPEFGTVVGILTVMGALGAFFIVRRK